MIPHNKFKLTEDMRSIETNLDIQLEEFINISNEFIDNIYGPKTYKSLVNFILYLSDYSKNHFLYQESIMNSKSYPSAEKHKSEHIEFIINISKIFKELLKKKKIDYIDGKAMLTDHQAIINDIYEFIANWVANHISVTDRRFNDFLKFEK